MSISSKHSSSKTNSDSDSSKGSMSSSNSSSSESSFSSNSTISGKSSLPVSVQSSRTSDKVSSKSSYSTISTDNETPVKQRVQKLEELAKDESTVVFDPECLRKKSSWSKYESKYNLVDNLKEDQSIEEFKEKLPTYSPKLDTLLKKIRQLDEKDQKEHGKMFKHFIFTDIKSSQYGVKLLASGLVSQGFTLAYGARLIKDSKKEKPFFGKIELTSDNELEKTSGSNFYVLTSGSIFEDTISVKMKKTILTRFNERPFNIYGENVRIIIMDSGFKEGIDLFDIKYIHIFEHQTTLADQKQVIGRGTRTCGQKGLEFHPTKGWPLDVFIYDLSIPESLTGLFNSEKTIFGLFLKSMNIDLRLYNFIGELEKANIIGSVDYYLNKNIHEFSISASKPPTKKKFIRSNLPPIISKYDKVETKGGVDLKKTGDKVKLSVRNLDLLGADINTIEDALQVANVDEVAEETIQKRRNHKEMRNYIFDNFSQFKWDKVKMENLCQTQGGGQRGGYNLIQYTPSQGFIKEYFTPENPVKGMLLNWSVGTGKTCAAIAASSSFERAGYTILWVTRSSLKNDIWKNMFEQVCNEVLRLKLTSGEIAMPSDQKKRMKLLSDSWRIRPLSYKQFSNLVSKQNKFYERLVKMNGEADPLQKTLLIIDEAHKLYGGDDLNTIERPDMEQLHKSIMNSYLVSGKNSVRLLLMTATPITNSPMELVKLLNLCKENQEQMPQEFDYFADKYLEYNTGKFSEEGLKEYLDDTAGYVSYLNREKDARQFAQPNIHLVETPIVNVKEVETFDSRGMRAVFNTDVL